MATNPNRPQYQDTIESTWGDSVADHVIRRYATAAERDADLAGFTLADLAGQVVALTTPPAGLYFHDGAAWHPWPANITQGGSLVQATGGAGNLDNIPFPVPFPHVCLSVVASSGASPLAWVEVNIGQTTNTKTGFKCYMANGATINGSTVRVQWIATGY